MTRESTNPAERAGHIVELGFLETAIEAAGYPTATHDPDDPSETPELVVDLGTDESQRQRSVRLSFVPVGDEMEACKFLQFWSPLPFDVAADRIEELRRAAAIVTDHAAIGRFGVQDDGTAYYRYVLAAPKHTLLDDDMIAELVSFVDFHQEHFGDFIEGVCDGGIEVVVLDAVIRHAG